MLHQNIVMSFSELTREIIDIDPHIRFVGVLTKNRTLDGAKYRDGVEKLFTENEAKMSFHYASLIWDTKQNMAYKLGNERFSLTEYDKVKQISVPMDKDNLILISTEVSADHNLIINKIIETLSKRKSVKE